MPEAMRFLRLGLTDGLEGREASERLEALGEVVGSDEGGQVSAQLIVGLVVIAGEMPDAQTWPTANPAGVVG
jgi:hypothetical protein